MLFQNVHGNQNESAIVIGDSEGESLDENAVGTSEELPEIIISDDDDEGDAEANTNYAAMDSIDEDSDRAFGELIVRELRKMTPAAKKEFKRYATRFLFP